MEPADLNPTPPDDPALEAWLRSGTALPPLPDHGFSHRVLAALPPPPAPVSSRVWACAVGAGAGLGVVALAMVKGDILLPALSAPNPLAEDLAHTVATPLALALAVLSLWFAFRHRWQRLLRP